MEFALSIKLTTVLFCLNLYNILSNSNTFILLYCNLIRRFFRYREKNGKGIVNRFLQTQRFQKHVRYTFIVDVAKIRTFCIIYDNNVSNQR